MFSSISTCFIFSNVNLVIHLTVSSDERASCRPTHSQTVIVWHASEMSCVLDTVRKGSMGHPVSTMWHQRTLTENSLGQSIEKCLDQSIKLRREHPVEVLCKSKHDCHKGFTSCWQKMARWLHLLFGMWKCYGWDSDQMWNLGKIGSFTPL